MTKYAKRTEKQKQQSRESARRYYYNNRERANKLQKIYYRNNIDRWKELDLQKKYGIGLKKYNAILLEQEGNCKICGTNQSEFKKSLAVDHCHKTKKIRGLLCGPCNTGLGSYRDNIELLRKAIKYLQYNA